MGESLQEYFAGDQHYLAVWVSDLSRCCTTMCTLILAVALRFGCEDMQAVVSGRVCVCDEHDTPTRRCHTVCHASCVAQPTS
jgi:hypothetical protein